MTRATLASDQLSPIQESTALSLAFGKTQGEAAKETGAGERTIKTWVSEQPAFVSRIRELRTEMTARALDRLTDQMVGAAETLGELCHQGKSEMVRLGAARAIIELGMKLRSEVELEERITSLEDRQRK